MSEERKTIYLCLAHMSDEGYEIFLMDLEDYKAELEEEDEEWV